jgi:hypothetical protein
MTNVEISALRKIAGDHRVPAMRRLHAIDRLAADANVYVIESVDDDRHHWDTRKYLSEYRPTGTRARRVVVALLRRLPESARRDDRLMFLRGEEIYRRGRVNPREKIFRLNPPETEPDLKSITAKSFDDVVREALRKVEIEHSRRQNEE